MIFSLICLLLLVPSATAADSIIGGEVSYVVRDGDSLELIAARLGTNVGAIAAKINIDTKKPIHKGQVFNLNTRKIVPMTVDNGIIINIPDRMLYFFHDRKLEQYFPVGLGRPPSKDSIDWSTPVGTFIVQRKVRPPTWYVPASIRKEMEAQGKSVPEVVPPGPENPLGRYAIKISIPGVLIHETNAPASVYKFRSHGCVRVMQEHIILFFEKVEINTPGELIYKPVKAAVSDEGKIFLEVHRDIYSRIKDLKVETMQIIEQLGVSEKVNWKKIETMLREKSGIAEDVTL
jgi:L,D-transpeptidase ErfK/SrfK